MRYDNGRFTLAATDLAGYLGCRHLTQLNRAVALGTRSAAPHYDDPQRDALIERGAEHERAYVQHLRDQGLSVAVVEGIDASPQAVEETIQSMAYGVDVVVQGALARDGWQGRVDVLRRVGTPSVFGAWSYEPVDTKLAQETKAGTILQLCVYSDLLSEVQGVVPEYMSVVTPWMGFEPERHRFAEYAAFYRRAVHGLEAFLRDEANTYPEPTALCDTCRWRQPCDEQRHADDHISLVAGVSRLQMAELRTRDIPTMKALSDVALPLPWKPERGAVETYVRVREQARVQVEAREAGERRFEVLHPDDGGLRRLPLPSLGDVFFDIEGDPFVGREGQEYLFGFAFNDDDGRPAYRHAWARSRAEEKAGFEAFVDFIVARLDRFPELHIYHYAPYEPAALKRLMGRYGTREDEVDRFLRGGLFVDLFSVVRHGVRASVESYSIKQLEAFYGFERAMPLRDAGRARARVEVCLELGDARALDADDCEVVRAYNEDDCRSAWRLRDWLEGLRNAAIARGVEIPRPPAVEMAPNENVAEWLARIGPVIEALVANVPVDPVARDVEQQGRWLLAHLLDWHRREQKAGWWEYFRLADLPAADLLDERSGLAGLVYVEEASGGGRRTPVHRYRFPEQDCELRPEDALRSCGGEKLGSVVAISLEARTIDIKKRQDTAEVHPTAVFAHKHVDATVIKEALLRLGEHVVAHGVLGDGPWRAARDLLLRADIALNGHVLRGEGESALDAALRLTRHLGAGVLPIQGPPGAGKTFTGARMICDLVARGQRVGVTANSHKVIRKLIDEAIGMADGLGANLRCCIKPDEPEEAQRRLTFANSNGELFDALREAANVAGGTAWLWARPEALGSVDVLFVDEAAQMALANVLAVSQCAPRLVLLGDPQQLDQPIQGAHPDGCAVSALHHLLADAPTISAEQGLFLDQTWRLHPDICRFTSELFYTGRLSARKGLERQALRSDSGPLRGSGLRCLTVSHSGNQNASLEEVRAIDALIRGVLGARTTWIDQHGVERLLEPKDILVITPYNAQVFALQPLIDGVHIGTVDKFQGQEAPLAIYSTASSSPTDAPRGMEFLYSLNRLNVATSRARCMSVLVASPLLFDAECRTPKHMRLANAFCRFLEMAEGIDLAQEPMTDAAAAYRVGRTPAPIGKSCDH